MKAPRSYKHKDLVANELSDSSVCSSGFEQNTDQEVAWLIREVFIQHFIKSSC